MQIERRALYNSLRMNWLGNPTLKVEPWQVEDYRILPTDAIFARLRHHDISLDRSSFLALTEMADSPEELSDDLLADTEFINEIQDQIYLLIFELWRRLAPEKPCLSILCDELDHQIYLYDHAEIESQEAIEDILANLEVVLDENADNGVDPKEVFDTISLGCANDIEAFLYDFISVQIDIGNDLYASELLDGFSDYVADPKWLDFLRARLTSSTEPETANKMIRGLVKNINKEPDLDLILEILNFVVQSGEHDVFVSLIKSAVPLLLVEEDFQDLLALSADYYHRLDQEQEEQSILAILRSRGKRGLEEKVSLQDPQIAELLKICNSR